jgi:acetylornithine deacetylase
MRLFEFLQYTLLATETLSYSISSQQPIKHVDTLEASRREPSLDLLSLHKQLVEIPSISRDEHNAVEWLAAYLRSQDFTVETQSVSSSPPRENLLAYLGSSSKTRTLVTSHIDTVPPYLPYERRGDEIWGRGSVDAKASVAAQVLAVQSLITSLDIGEGDVGLLFVVGEEISGDGMRAVNDLGLSWETVIFGEPTELKLVSGHKGHLEITIRAHGKAGHSGYPELGRNANSMLIPALSKLSEIEWPSSQKYGNTTINIGRIEGGVAANVIAEEAYAYIAVRIAAGQPEELKGLVREVLLEVDRDLEISFSPGYGPVPIDHDVEGEFSDTAYFAS